MKILFSSLTVLLLVLMMAIIRFIAVPIVYAATAPSLGNAASFSVLAALSMSAAGAGTTVSGNLGLSPGLAVSRTGPWTVGGTEYFGIGGLSQNAQTDALTAFNNLAGQASDGGWSGTPWSPTPGVYTVAVDTTFTGTITLNGGYDDVWVFQVGRDMTFSGSVIMAGNAQPCNVFWQIGRDATIASGSTFVGTLIASRDITLVSGATVDGRIISLNSSLTTDGNNITGPTCAAAPTPTPTPSPTPTPTSTSTPTPTPTPSPNSSTSSSSSSGSSTGCVAPVIKYAPTITESRRLSPTSIHIKWTAVDGGISNYMVQYGLEDGQWLWNTIVNGLETDLNNLPSNQMIWVRVAGYNCTVGSYSESKPVGNPQLPHAGFGPTGNFFSNFFRAIIQWSEYVQILFGTLTLL